MVEADLATDPYIAGAVVTTALLLLYFLLTLLVWLTPPFRSDTAQTQEYSTRSKLLGFDERGNLRIDSDYPVRN